MKKLLAYVSAFALITAVSSTALAQVTAGAPGGPEPVPASAAPAEKGEHHPHLHKAKHALENAKKALQEAAHDYGGHRAAALEHVDAAIKEVDEALNYDKK